MLISPTLPTLTLLSMVAYAVLAIAGAVFWKRSRSRQTALVAIGFALVLPDQLSTLLESFVFSAVQHSRPGDTYFVIHHHAFLHYVSLLGLCVAAVGLMWEATRKSAPARVS